MKEQMLLSIIKYQGKRYAIFTNIFHQKSFLEIKEDGSFKYPELDIYIKLNSIYNINKVDKLYFKPPKTNFEPKIILKNKFGQRIAIKATTLLLTLGLITSIGKINTNKTTPNINNIAISDQDIDNTQDISDEIKVYLNLLKRNGYDCDILNDGTIYLKSINSTETKLICTDSNSKLKHMLPLKIVTFNDVREAINNNISINDEFKNILYDYIEKTQTNSPNIDLTTFYYNLTKLKVVIEDKDEIKEATTEDTVAYFNSLSHEIHFPAQLLYNSDKGKYVANHEITHMFNNAVFEKNISPNETLSLKQSLSLVIPSFDEEGNVIINYLGTGFSEGLNDLIKEQNIGIENLFLDSYVEISDEISIIANCLGEDINTIFEKGIIYFIDKMSDFGIDNATNLIELMDIYCQSDKESSILLETDIREEIYKSVFKALTNNLIKEGKSSEEIYTKVLDCLDNSFIENHIKNNDLLMKEKYTYKQYKIKNTIIKYISDILSKYQMNTTDSYEEAIKLYKDKEKIKNNNINLNNTYIYEDINHDIKICYLNEETNKYYQKLNNEEIPKESILHIESFNKLNELGLVEANYDKQSPTININVTSLKEYFSNNITSNNLFTIDNLYIYLYEDAEGIKLIEEAYLTYDENENPILYDRNSLKRINLPIINGEYAKVLEQKGLIELDDYGKIIYLQSAKLINYLSLPPEKASKNR